MHGRENILNIVMLGTGQHRDSVKNILTSIVESLEVDSHQFVHLIDGPAGKHRDKNHLMLGTYDVKVEFDPTTNKIITQKSPKSALGKASELAGNVKGEGYEDAIKEARMVVNEMLLAGKTPLELNLFGFSRGADTMLRVANVLYGLYGDAVKVNIFAIDPVPGIGRQHARKARVIPPNVKEYNAFLMEDEKRIEFEAQNRSHVILQNPNTKLNYHFYRGNHGFATRFEADPNKDKRPIHHSSRLLWDEAVRFATRHKLRFKNNLSPAYIVTGGASGKKTFTQVASKPLTDAERFVAYTRMSVNPQAYRDHVRTLSNYRSVMTKNREFIDRKFDYILHGQNAFQDKEHLLLFKKHFPAVFDYFFQQNLGKIDLLAVRKELVVINVDPDLKKFMLDNAGIDASKDPEIEGPQGIFLNADTYYNKSNELRRIWEGIVEAVGAVEAGYDTSISKATARHFQQQMLAILIGPDNDTDKIVRLKSILATTAQDRQNKKGGEFAYKLATIAGSLTLMDDTIADRIIRKMDDYLNRPAMNEALFRNQTLSLRKKAIMQTAQRYLRELNKHGLGNEAQPIQTILDIAYASVGEVRTTLDHPGEGRFENTLRELALQISCYSPVLPLSNADIKAKADTINPIIDRYNHEMHNALQPVRDPRLQNYTDKARHVIEVSNRILASRRDIIYIDKALATCKHLLNRFNDFDKKLWENDPAHDLIAKQIKKLTNLQKTLEQAQAQYQNKTYQPQSIVYTTHHAEVINAPADQLATEVSKALAKSTPAIENMGGLSETAPSNTTIDFVRDQARISSLKIKTGLGLFAKATTVKSVKWMQGDTFQSDIHYNPAELSRFGAKGYLTWAIREVEEFQHTNPMTEKTIDFKGKLPEKFVRYAIAYCQIQNIPYLNNVNSKFEPTAGDLKEVRDQMKKESLNRVDKKMDEIDTSLRNMAADVPSIPTKKV